MPRAPDGADPPLKRFPAYKDIVRVCEEYFLLAAQVPLQK